MDGSTKNAYLRVVRFGGYDKKAVLKLVDTLNAELKKLVIASELKKAGADYEKNIPAIEIPELPKVKFHGFNYKDVDEYVESLKKEIVRMRKELDIQDAQPSETPKEEPASNTIIKKQTIGGYDEKAVMNLVNALSEEYGRLNTAFELKKAGKPYEKNIPETEIPEIPKAKINGLNCKGVDDFLASMKNDIAQLRAKL